MNKEDADLVERAIEIAVQAHHGQRDMSGESYILHPLRVMAAVRALGGSPAMQAAAVLHDTVEDTFIEIAFIYHRFGREVGDLVEKLTRRGPEQVYLGDGNIGLIDEETYPDFIDRVMSGPHPREAMIIKECDINDNMSRLASVQDEAKRERLRKKYTAALAKITIHGYGPA